MRKYLLILCCLTLTLASCKKDVQEPSQTPENPVNPGSSCETPRNLSHSVNEFDVTLYWSGTSEMYELYCNDSLIASEITDTTYLDVVADYGSYLYKVKGICGDVESEFSEEDPVMIYSNNDQCPAPGNLTAIANDNDVTLSWTGYSDHYIIYRNNVSITEIAESSYSDIDLEPGNYIYFIVGKCDDLGGMLSPQSNSVEVVIEEVITPCNPPTNFSADVTAQNDVSLSWQGDAESYTIYRNDYPIVTEITESSYIDLAPGFGTFIYKVKAVCSGEESPFSDEVTVVISEGNEDPMIGDYQGDVFLNGTVFVMGQTMPYSNTLTDMTMNLAEGDVINTLNVTMTLNGSTGHVVATVDGNNINIPDETLENMIIPVNYMGMTLDMEADILLSDMLGVFNPDDESIDLTGLATGVGLVEEPVFGQQQVDINLPLTGVFYKKRL